MPGQSCAETTTETHLLLEPLVLEVIVTALVHRASALHALLPSELDRLQVDHDILLDNLLLLVAVLPSALQRLHFRPHHIRLKAPKRYPHLDMTRALEKTFVQGARLVELLF